MIRRVLIVGPEPKITCGLFELLHFEFGRYESERYEPEIAESFTDAIEQAQTVNFHCIIMDADLPEMEDREVIRLMKTISKNTPIIINTDKNTLELETKAREQNVYYYHVRSSNQSELKLVVGSVFENLEKARVGREIDKAATKPVILKRLRRLFQKEEH